MHDRVKKKWLSSRDAVTHEKEICITFSVVARTVDNIEIIY